MHSHNAIENKVYYDLAITLRYFSNKERKQIDKPEIIAAAKRGTRGPASPVEKPPMVKMMPTKPVFYSISVSRTNVTNNNVNVDDQGARASYNILTTI